MLDFEWFYRKTIIMSFHVLMSISLYDFFFMLKKRIMYGHYIRSYKVAHT